MGAFLFALAFAALLAPAPRDDARVFASIRALDAQLAAHPDSASLQTQLALNYLLLDQRELAAAALKRALDLNPREAQAHYLAGRLALEVEQNPQEAIDEFRRTLSIEKSSFKARYFLGISFSELGQCDAARKSFEESAKTATYSWPFRSLAETDLLLNDAQHALPPALKAVVMEPGSAENALTAARVYHALNQNDKAVHMAQQASRLEPLWDAPHFLLGNIYAARPQTRQQSTAEFGQFRRLKEQDAPAGMSAGPAQSVPQARSPSELDAYGTVVLARQPADTIHAGEDFLSRYAGSEFRKLVLETEFQSFRQRNDYEAVKRLGAEISRLLPPSPGILSDTALMIANQGDTRSFSEAAEYAARALEVIGRMPRPLKMRREEFATWKAGIISSAHTARGVLALRNKDSAAALTELQEAIRIRSDPDGALYLRLGEAYLLKNQVAEASDAFSRAEALGPESVTLAARQQVFRQQAAKERFARARDREKAGNLIEAAAEYEQVVRENPAMAEAFHNLGLVYYRLRHYGRAEKNLERALELNTNLKGSHLFLGLSQFRLAKFNDSAKNLELALQQEPASRETYLFLIRDYIALDRFPPDIVNRALSFDPNDPELNYAVGLFCLERIRGIARIANAAGPHSPEFVWLNARRAKQREDTAGLQKYGALAAHVEEPALIREYDTTAVTLQRAFETVLESGASSREAHSVRGYIHESRNDVDQALEEYRAAGDYFEAGRLLAQNVRLDEAEEAFRKSVAEDPQNERAKADLAKTYLQNNHPDKAISLLKELVDQYPADAYAWADLGKAYAETGETQPALLCFRNALERDGSLNQVHYQLAILYRKLREETLARQEFQKFEVNRAEAH
jgi:tetratricopeptide (TPR) repeat protein